MSHTINTRRVYNDIIRICKLGSPAAGDCWGYNYHETVGPLTKLEEIMSNAWERAAEIAGLIRIFEARDLTDNEQRVYWELQDELSRLQEIIWEAEAND